MSPPIHAQHIVPHQEPILDKVPAQVARQVEAAEALQASLYAPPEPTEPAVAAAPEGDGNVEQVQEQPTAQHQEPQTQAPPEPAPSADARNADPVYLRNRLSTLMGMYNTHVPQLQAQVRELTTERDQLKAQLQERDKKQPQEQTPQSRVTDKDREAFGPEMIDLINRAAADQIAAARGEFDQVIAARDQTIDELRKQLGQVDQRTARSETDRFYDALIDAHPDFPQLNGDARFIKWLNQSDPLSGFSGMALLRDAADRLDVQRAAAIVDAYKRATGVSTPPAAAAPAPVQPTPPSGQEQLRRQVAPPKTAAAPAAPVQEATWTEEEYARAFDPRTHRGMPEAEVQKLMADADRAVREGRLVPTARRDVFS